jgi:hypothetical protein
MKGSITAPTSDWTCLESTERGLPARRPAFTCTHEKSHSQIANGFFSLSETTESIHLFRRGFVLVLVPHPGEEGDEADGDQELVEEGSDRRNEREYAGEKTSDEVPEGGPECYHVAFVYGANIERIPGHPQAEKSYF